MNPEENGTVVDQKENPNMENGANAPAESKETQQEKTWFGKVDDKIIASRAAKAKKKEDKAAKKQAKAEQKAAKQASKEEKKFSWGTAAAVAAGVIGVIGTAVAVVEHNNGCAAMPEQTCESCGEEPKTEALPEPVQETVPAEPAATQEVSANSET
jgi:hypothetical protein